MSRLLCGRARRNITPEEKDLYGLCGLMGIPYNGIIDDLYVRVIALQNEEEKLLLISFDLDKAPNPQAWLKQIADRTGISEDRILYLAIHTHSAPLTTVRANERDWVKERRENMNRYEEMVLKKLLEAVDEATMNMQEAEIGFGNGQSYINVQRNAVFERVNENGKTEKYLHEGMNMAAEIDHTVSVLRINDTEHQPLAFFINYPVHCCVMFCNDYDGQGNMGISSDIGGNVSAALEKEYPQATAIWSSGAAGNIDPLMMNSFTYPDFNGCPKTEQITDWKSLKIFLNTLVGLHHRDIKKVISSIDHYDNALTLKGGIRWISVPSQKEEEERIRLQLVRIGETEILGIGGELYNSYATEMEKVKEHDHLLFVNHNASMIDDANYILDDETLKIIEQADLISNRIPGGRTRYVRGTVGKALLEGYRCLSEETK